MTPLNQSYEGYRLSIFEECLGKLLKLEEQESDLLATIGKVDLLLPPEMEQDLKPFLGRRISILRTDIPGKKYLFRKVSEND